MRGGETCQGSLLLVLLWTTGHRTEGGKLNHFSFIFLEIYHRSRSLRPAQGGKKKTLSDHKWLDLNPVSPSPNLNTSAPPSPRKFFHILSIQKNFFFLYRIYDFCLFKIYIYTDILSEVDQAVQMSSKLVSAFFKWMLHWPLVSRRLANVQRPLNLTRNQFVRSRWLKNWILDSWCWPIDQKSWSVDSLLIKLQRRRQFKRE